MERPDAAWLADELDRATAQVSRFAAMIPESRMRVPPPSRGSEAPLGTWSAHQLISHLLDWESRDVVRALGRLVGESDAPAAPRTPYDPEPAVPDLLAALAGVRREEARLVRLAGTARLENATRSDGRSFLWLLAHVVQHNWEHANTIGQIALLWDHHEERLSR